jgi:hypothetical protein
VSIPISPDDLEAAAEGRPWVFLITSSSGSEASHVVSLRVEWANAGCMRLTVGEGRAARNITAGSSPVVVFPPGGSGERAEYSIIVDGEASLDGGVLTITPSGAMWHRPAR